MKGCIQIDDSEYFDEELTEITNDLITDRDTFVGNLFSLESGEWGEVKSLCDRVVDIDVILSIEYIEEMTNGEVIVTWLEHKNSSYGEGYCIILFFHEATVWSNAAIYNRRLFLNKRMNS